MSLPPKSPTPEIPADVLAALTTRPAPIAQAERDALGRLLRVAQSNTGQSRKVADFLLAWWNAGSCGAWDPTDLWGLDASLANDTLTVLGLIGRLQNYPDTHGYGDEFRALVAQWRPQLMDDED